MKRVRSRTDFVFKKLDMPDEFPVCGLSQDPEKNLDRIRHRVKIRKSVRVEKMTTFLYTGHAAIQGPR